MKDEMLMYSRLLRWHTIVGKTIAGASMHVHRVQCISHNIHHSTTQSNQLPTS